MLLFPNLARPNNMAQTLDNTKATIVTTAARAHYKVGELFCIVESYFLNGWHQDVTNYSDFWQWADGCAQDIYPSEDKKNRMRWVRKKMVFYKVMRYSFHKRDIDLLIDKAAITEAAVGNN